MTIDRFMQGLALAAKLAEVRRVMRIAANAVMAGCRPEYFPIVMLSMEAMGDEAYNLYGVQATTHPCTPLIIVNGPVGRELEINSGYRAFGAGPRICIGAAFTPTGSAPCRLPP